jgi:hypothetical protein
MFYYTTLFSQTVVFVTGYIQANTAHHVVHLTFTHNWQIYIFTTEQFARCLQPDYAETKGTTDLDLPVQIMHVRKNDHGRSDVLQNKQKLDPS